VNNPILYGWFWAAKKRVRTAADLVDIYYQSVGRNGNWLLNLSPDTRGLVPDDQLASLHLATEVINKTFSKNLAAGARLTADSSAPTRSASSALDGNLDTWWEAAVGHTTATFILKLPRPVTFDVVSLQEAIDHRSQRIESFNVDVWDGSNWKTVDQQTTVGHKRLLRWSSAVTTDQVRIHITGSRLEPTLAEVGLFKQAELMPPPVVSDRDISGSIRIAAPKGLPVVYTVDGSVPTAKSTIYREPVSLPRGGELQAAYLTPSRELGMLATKYFSGLSPIGWKVVSGGSEDADHPAKNVIDGDSSTFWESSTADNSSFHQITVDMGAVQQIAGFSCLPRQDGVREATIQGYRFETSTDGVNWKTDIDSGRFANVRNNPVVQEVPFEAVAARFFRFTALQSSDTRASAAEISVLPAEQH
jgi:alpha-L-fucosidase